MRVAFFHVVRGTHASSMATTAMLTFSAPRLSYAQLFSFQIAYSNNADSRGYYNSGTFGFLGLVKKGEWKRAILEIDFTMGTLFIQDKDRIILSNTFQSFRRHVAEDVESDDLLVSIRFENEQWEVIAQNITEKASLHHILKCILNDLSPEDTACSGIEKGLIGLDKNIMKYGLVYRRARTAYKKDQRFLVIVPGKLILFKALDIVGKHVRSVASLLGATVHMLYGQLEFEVIVPNTKSFQFLPATAEELTGWVGTIQNSIEYANEFLGDVQPNLQRARPTDDETLKTRPARSPYMIKDRREDKLIKSNIRDADYEGDEGYDEKNIQSERRYDRHQVREYTGNSRDRDQRGYRGNQGRPDGRYKGQDRRHQNLEVEEDDRGERNEPRPRKERFEHDSDEEYPINEKRKHRHHQNREDNMERRKAYEVVRSDHDQEGEIQERQPFYKSKEQIFKERDDHRDRKDIVSRHSPRRGKNKIDHEYEEYEDKYVDLVRDERRTNTYNQERDDSSTIKGYNDRVAGTRDGYDDNQRIDKGKSSSFRDRESEDSDNEWSEKEKDTGTSCNYPRSNIDARRVDASKDNFIRRSDRVDVKTKPLDETQRNDDGGYHVGRSTVTPRKKYEDPQDIERHTFSERGKSMQPGREEKREPRNFERDITDTADINVEFHPSYIAQQANYNDPQEIKDTNASEDQFKYRPDKINMNAKPQKGIWRNANDEYYITKSSGSSQDHYEDQQQDRKAPLGREEKGRLRNLDVDKADITYIKQKAIESMQRINEQYQPAKIGIAQQGTFEDPQDIGRRGATAMVNDSVEEQVRSRSNKAGMRTKSLEGRPRNEDGDYYIRRSMKVLHNKYKDAQDTGTTLSSETGISIPPGSEEKRRSKRFEANRSDTSDLKGVEGIQISKDGGYIPRKSNTSQQGKYEDAQDVRSVRSMDKDSLRKQGSDWSVPARSEQVEQRRQSGRYLVAIEKDGQYGRDGEDSSSLGTLSSARRRSVPQQCLDSALDEMSSVMVQLRNANINSSTESR